MLLTAPDPALVDPLLPLKQLSSYAEALTDSRQLRTIEVLRQHMYHELVAPDVDAIMKTMVSEPEILYFGLEGKDHDVGYDAVRNHYASTIHARDNTITFHIHRVIADHESIVIDGYQVAKPEFVEACYGVSFDTSKPIVIRKAHVVVVTVEDGLVFGEYQYFDGMYSDRDVYFIES